jgi:putative MATE family efflux protein
MAATRRTNRLDDFIRSPKRSVWMMALPMMAAFATHAFYMVFDMAFIGRIGSSALAAAQFVGALFFGVIALNIGFTTGVTAVVARAVGERDRPLAERTAGNAMGLGLVLGVAIAGIGYTAAPTLIPLLGATGETTELALQYFEVLCIGMLFMFVSGAIRAVLTGEGDAKTPMAVVIIATFINLILDPVFMFVLGFGIRGAAMATVTSQLFTVTAFCYVAFVKRRSYIPFRWSIDRLRPRAHLIAPIFKIGLPAAMVQLVMSFGAILYNRIIAEFGQAAVAGYGAGSKVDMIVAMPIMALASAVLSVVGMFAGAKRYDLVRKIILYAFRTVLLITFVFCAVAFVASSHIIGIFTADPVALETGRVYLRYMVIAYPLMAIGVTSGRVLQGLGQGIPPLVIAVMRVLLIGVPASFVSVAYYGAPIETIWISMIAGGLAADVLALYWIRHYGWKREPLPVGKPRPESAPAIEPKASLDSIPP